MVGRFIGACLLKIFSPGKVLACAARGVVTLLLISANSIRNISGYSLACEELSERAAERFGIISPVLPHVILLPDASSTMLPVALGPMGFGSFMNRKTK